MFRRRPFDLDFSEKMLSLTSEELEALYNEMGQWEPYGEAYTTPNQMKLVTQVVIGGLASWRSGAVTGDWRHNSQEWDLKSLPAT